MATPGPLVVVGDALLDVDLVGHASRLAPDAPAPVLDRLSEARRPGGAGLAASLAAGAGADVVLVTAVADDETGAEMEGLLADAGVKLEALPCSGGTPVKRRVLADGRMLVRLDSGGDRGPAGVTDDALRAIAGAGALLVSDYGRGVSGLVPVRAALAERGRRVPLVWDPHPRGSTPVRGARLVTPNAAEAASLAAGTTAAPGSASGEGLAAVAERAATLMSRWHAHAVAVTLGDRGALLSQGESSPSVIPAPRVRGGDACGAGDRFAASAALALAAGTVTREAVQLAVAQASAFVAAGGAGAWEPGAPSAALPSGRDRIAEIRARGGTVVATGGCFDLIHAGHIATLLAARALGDCLVVCINSDDSVRRLKGDSRPLVPQADRVRVLEALEPVDAVVVFDEDTPTEVLRRIRPDVWAKGGDYAGVELPESALLRQWGGQSVVLPYLDGRSTTGLLATAVERVRSPR